MIRRSIPLWYPITILALIIIGAGTNLFVSHLAGIAVEMDEQQLLNTINLINFVNLTISISWGLINAYLVFRFIQRRYEWIGIALAGYFVAINGFSVGNYLFGWLSDVGLLLTISWWTKAIVGLIAVGLLVRAGLRRDKRVLKK